MKVQINVTEITHEDLVNLICTASYGSCWLGLDYDRDEYNKLADKKDDDCIEDKLARLLLAGKSVILVDFDSEEEDDYYGDLQHKWNDECNYMEYTITLEDVKKGLGKAAIDCEYSTRCFNDFSCDSNKFDLYEAECLAQYIMFGKQVYG